jgi:hypothetical protein
MESHFSQRWYGVNQKGEHTFFIEVYSSNILDELFFETSLPVGLFSEPGITNLVNKLCKIDLPLSERNKIAEKMISKIERISDMQKFYFTDMVLDKNGKYCEAYASTLNQLKTGQILIEFTPYSSLSNEAIFHDFQNSFIYDELKHECVRVDRKTFEASISGNIALQKAYADIYCDNAEYYFHESAKNGISMTFYCVVINKALYLIYFTQLQEITSVVP